MTTSTFYLRATHHKNCILSTLSGDIEVENINIKSKSIAVACFVFAITVSTNSVIAEEQEFLTEAKLLLTDNQPLQAMELLESHMDEGAGLPDYDYLLGKAALFSKKSNLAIFALERVSLMKPDFYNARFLLGKAYLNAGTGLP